MHLSSQYACETRRSYYLNSTEILQFCRTESWSTEAQGRQAGLLQAWQQGVPPGAPAQGAGTCSCLGFLWPFALALWHKAQGPAMVQCHMSLVSSARGLFAHPACFVDGGNILKRKEWMESPVIGSMALAPFFSGPPDSSLVLCACQLEQNHFWGALRETRLTIPVNSRG